MNTMITICNQLNCEIYISSFNNKEQEEKIIKGLNETFLTAHIYSNQLNDPRVAEIVKRNNEDTPDSYNTFFNILKMIEDFYQFSNKEYGLFLKNNIQFKKSILIELPKVLNDIKRLNLDVLLIGYLLDCRPEQYGCQ